MNRQTRPRLMVAALLLMLALLAGCGELPGDAPAPSQPTAPPAAPTTGSGGSSTASVYSVYFTTPTGSTDETTYTGGPDETLAAAIASASRSVDVAAFELNSPAITQALLAVHGRGLPVRIVTDDDHGLDVGLYQEYLAEDDPDAREFIAEEFEEPLEDTSLDQLYDAGIPIVDDDRSALMHNKFVIIDSTDLWTGSMNLTRNGAYRNNNNLIRFRNQRMVQNYQTEFNEMFVDGQFGPRSPANTPNPQFSINGYPVEVYFAPEDEVVDEVVEEVNAAQQRIRFMAFSFTLDEVGEAMAQRGQAGVTVEGVFETTGSQTQYSELTRLFCARYDVRQDGGPFILHHKVIIIDDAVVLIGSFNFSDSATRSNDENLVVIRDPSVVGLYLAEWQARFAEGEPPEPGDVSCP